MSYLRNAQNFYAKYGYMNPKLVGPGITGDKLDGQTFGFMLMEKKSLMKNDLSYILNKLKERHNIEINLSAIEEIYKNLIKPLLLSQNATMLSVPTPSVIPNLTSSDNSIKNNLQYKS